MSDKELDAAYNRWLMTHGGTGPNWFRMWRGSPEFAALATPPTPDGMETAVIASMERESAAAARIREVRRRQRDTTADVTAVMLSTPPQPDLAAALRAWLDSHGEADIEERLANAANEWLDAAPYVGGHPDIPLHDYEPDGEGGCLACLRVARPSNIEPPDPPLRVAQQALASLMAQAGFALPDPVQQWKAPDEEAASILGAMLDAEIVVLPALATAPVPDAAGAGLDLERPTAELCAAVTPAERYGIVNRFLAAAERPHSCANHDESLDEAYRKGFVDGAAAKDVLATVQRALTTPPQAPDGGS